MLRTSFINEKKLPLVIEPENNGKNNSGSDALLALCDAEREYFHEILRLHGALLFRGFKVFNEKDFEQFVRVFARRELMDYRGGASPRVRLQGAVYTSTEYPSEYTISLHNELSYSDKYPNHIYFCCLVPPATGGETPIADSRRLRRNIKPEIVEIFKQKKIKYVRNLPSVAGDNYSWQDVFATADKTEVEEVCRRIQTECVWKTNGNLQLSQIRPATIEHPTTREEVWFNQAENFHPSAIDAATLENLLAVMKIEDLRLNSYFGDGAPLDVADLEHIRAVGRGEMILFPWQKGDCLVLDNLLVAHGRMPFSGARKIVVAMT